MSTKNPSKVFDNNLEGTYQILKFAKEKKNQKLFMPEVQLNLGMMV